MLQKPHIKYLVIKLIIFTILAVLVFVFRDSHVEHLKPFIGALMILYGLDGILFEIVCHKKGFLYQNKTYLGLIELIFGIVLISASLIFEYVCIIWATWSIIRESFEIKEIVSDLKMIAPKILSSIESVIVIVFSVLLIIEPGEHHILIHMGLLTAELILNPLVILIDEFLLARKIKKEAIKNQEDNKEN